MVVVIYVWLAYFNSLITGTVPQAAIAENQATGSVGVWQNIGNGMASLYGYSVSTLRGLGNILQAPRQYIVKPPH